jgi:hypothetical protein
MHSVACMPSSVMPSGLAHLADAVILQLTAHPVNLLPCQMCSAYDVPQTIDGFEVGLID